MASNLRLTGLPQLRGNDAASLTNWASIVAQHIAAIESSMVTSDDVKSATDLADQVKNSATRKANPGDVPVSIGGLQGTFSLDDLVQKLINNNAMKQAFAQSNGSSVPQSTQSSNSSSPTDTSALTSQISDIQKSIATLTQNVTTATNTANQAKSLASQTKPYRNTVYSAGNNWDAFAAALGQTVSWSNYRPAFVATWGLIYTITATAPAVNWSFPDYFNTALFVVGDMAQVFSNTLGTNSVLTWNGSSWA